MNIRRTLVSLLSTIVVTLTMLGIVLINAQTSDEEPDLSYRTLDYDVAVQRNGDLKVTQHIDMRLKDRGRDWKQMYQRYTLKSKNLTDISAILGSRTYPTARHTARATSSSPTMPTTGTTSMRDGGTSWTSLRMRTILSRSIRRPMG